MKNQTKSKVCQTKLHQVRCYFIKYSLSILKIFLIACLKNYIFIDSNTPSLRLCLRLPNGSKETISMLGSERIQVIFHFSHLLCIYYKYDDKNYSWNIVMIVLGFLEKSGKYGLLSV